MPDSWLMIIDIPTTPPSKIVNGTRNSSSAKAATMAPTVMKNRGAIHCLKIKANVICCGCLFLLTGVGIFLFSHKK